MLSIQKKYQTELKTKGNTIFIFDNEEREKMRFTDLIRKPPSWSESFYKKAKKDEPLNQIIDVPYFGDSKEVALIQVADFICYFLRRYAEIKENLIPPKYTDEEKKINNWAKDISARSIGRSITFPSRGRCKVADIFYENAYPS